MRRSAAPNPFSGAQAFAVEPIQYVDLQVDGEPEAQYLADADAEKRSAWQWDKENVSKVFATAVRDTVGDAIRIDDSATYRVRPTVSVIESGYYRIPAWNAVTKIFLTVQITDGSGQVADEIQCSDGVAFDAMFNPTVGGRLATVAKSLGRVVGEYLAGRVGG